MSFIKGAGFVHDAAGATPAGLIAAAGDMNATEEAAFLAAVGAPASTDLADFARGQHHLPLAVSRNRQAGQFPSTSTPALTILTFGDSLGIQFGQQAYDEGLIRGSAFMGYKLMAQDFYTVISGTTPPASDSLPSGDWLTGRYIPQSQSTTLQWARSANIPCNRISIAYLKGTGSSTVTLQYSQNGGSSWTTAATIDTSAAANEFNFAVYSLPSPRPTLVRTVTAAGHAIKLIGCGAWTGEEGAFNGRNGYVVVCGARGGVSVADVVASVTETTWSTLMSSAKVDMVLQSWNDFKTDWDAGGNIDTLRTRADVGRVADWVMVSTVSGDSSTPGAPDAIDMREQRVAMRDWALRNNQNFLDWAGSLRDSWDYGVELGIYGSGDTIHPTAYGYRVRQAYIAEQLGRVLNSSDGFVGNVAINLGNTYRLRSDPYGVTLEALGSNNVGLYLGGANATIGLQSATDSDPWRALSYSYTGSENAGLTFGWVTARQQGSPKTALQFTATGNSDSTNLETVSSYPLVIATRRVNATPSTPAAGSIKPFWRLNGSSKWEFCVVPPSGTVHTIWTEP